MTSAVVSHAGWFDGRLDLASLALVGRDMTLAAEAVPAPAAGAPHHQKAVYPAAVTFPSLREGPVTEVIGTIFTQLRGPAEKSGKDGDPCACGSAEEAYAACRVQLGIYQQWHRAGLIQLIYQPSDGDVRPRQIGMACGPPPRYADEGVGTTFSANSGAPRVLLMLEGAGGVRDIEDLRTFYAAGVRIISLPFWIAASRWAGGNRSGGDLTAEGRTLVAEIDRLGMIHDVSHLSEKSFWSLLECSAGRICATHSNCRALLAGKERDERNLTDAQIRALLSRGDRQGVIGINLYSAFLTVGRRAKIGDVVAHLQHICQISGRADGIALGSDMDGGLSALDLPENLDHPRHLHRLAEALADAGFTDNQIAGFQAGNWRRFLDLSTDSTDLHRLNF
ncbi:MAG: membrane dipeptidase [Phycisphaerae bacterium]